MVNFPTKTWNAETVRNGAKHVMAGHRVVSRPSKRIGVEIEFFGVDYSLIVRKLAEAGIPMRNTVEYTHTVMNVWKVVMDASVNGRGTNFMYSPSVGSRRQVGLELVSPPMTAERLIPQLATVLRVLKENGAAVDLTCGVHVHHEIDDLTLENVKNIFKIYHKHTDTIDSLMRKTRRSEGSGGMNEYCKPIDRWDVERFDGYDSLHALSEHLNSNHGRRKTLNLGSYVRYGTIEFRQHGGTLEFTELANWILLTQAIVAAAKAKKTIKDGGTNVVALERELGIVGSEQIAYVIKRRKDLAKYYKDGGDDRGDFQEIG